ncbi:MAG: DNA translocase FtsK [Chloroflexi bacterium]|nr:MAG: DNA translocase FtsK [Chloroflexota bacterium]
MGIEPGLTPAAEEEMMRQLLEFQADQIEMVLQGHRVRARVTGGVVTPRWISFQLVPEVAARVSKIFGLSEELALRLGAESVRISRRGSQIQIDVPHPNPQTVHLLPLLRSLPNLPKQSAVLGLDESGTPLVLRLTSPDVAHVLVAGTTGSGKTALVRSIALSLALFNRLGDVQMVFIDPKGSGFAPFVQGVNGGVLPHLLRPPVRDVHRAVFLLGEMVEEMVRRDQRRISEPRIVIFIDELADLMEQGGKAMDRLMTRLTQRGRSAGIHLIACTQKPLVAAIGSITRSNFPVRLVGSVASADDAKIAAGIPNSGAEKLLGRGDFVLVAKGQIRRFQAAYVSDDEIRNVVGRMQGSRAQSRRWLEEEESAASAAATGTDGKATTPRPRRRISSMFGHQLRLIK